VGGGCAQSEAKQVPKRPESEALGLPWGEIGVRSYVYHRSFSLPSKPQGFIW